MTGFCQACYIFMSFQYFKASLSRLILHWYVQNEIYTSFVVRFSLLLQHDACYLWSRNCLPFRSTCIHSWCLWYSIFSLMYNVLLIIVCPFVIFALVIVLSSFLDLRLLIVPLVSSNSSYIMVLTILSILHFLSVG